MTITHATRRARLHARGLFAFVSLLVFLIWEWHPLMDRPARQPANREVLAVQQEIPENLNIEPSVKAALQSRQQASRKAHSRGVGPFGPPEEIVTVNVDLRPVPYETLLAAVLKDVLSRQPNGTQEFTATLQCALGVRDLDTLCGKLVQRHSDVLSLVPSSGIPVSSKSANVAKRRDGRPGSFLERAVGDAPALKAAIGDQAKSMRTLFLNTAVAAGTPYPNVTQLLTQSACLLPRNKKLALGELLLEPTYTADFLLVGAAVLNEAVAGSLHKAASLLHLFRSYSFVYIVITDKDQVKNVATSLLFDDMLAPNHKCSVTSVLLPSSLGHRVSRLWGAAALRVSCGARAVRVAKRHCGAITPDCMGVHSPEALSINKMLKSGTKTGVYLGTGGGGNTTVLLKHFNVGQYSLFNGFHALSSHPLRTPLVNYPEGACLDRASSDSVFQVQPFIRGENLNKFMQRSKSKKLAWSDRLELAVQLVCAMHFLHHHPLGVFTYDDNHPQQYMVTENGSGMLLRMIDIDTVQLGKGDGRTGLNNVSTRCRCFYCRGKSNCMFVNTLEGYEGCGQSEDDPESGNHEVLKNVLPGRRCSAAGDMWFTGQMLIFLVDGAAPWQHKSLAEVLRLLRSGVVPSHPSGDEEYDAIAEHCMTQRTDTGTVLEGLSRLCEKYNCRMPKCPPTFFAPKPFEGLQL